MKKTIEEVFKNYRKANILGLDSINISKTQFNYYLYL
jgi:hypothetical protein